MTTAKLLLAIAAMLLAVTAAGAKKPSPSVRNGTAPPPPPQTPPKPMAAAQANCSDELVAFSRCLGYISSAPNNTTDTPSGQCCGEVAMAFRSGNAVCFCYLVQKPRLLGFPLNSTRILSLSSLCPVRDDIGSKANFSLSSLCSKNQSLPPLSSIKGPERPKPRISDPEEPTVPSISGPENPPPPPPTANLTQETNADSGTPKQFDDQPCPKPTVQVFQPWRTFDIGKSGANLAGTSLSWWFLVTSLLVFLVDCK